MSWDTVVQALRASPFVSDLHAYDEVDSTNDTASALLRDGAPDGTVVIADAQSAGKGRAGRRWYSPRGAGVWLSVIRRLPWGPERAAQVTLDVAVAVARAIESSVGLAPRLKWPNDLLLGGRKCAGILTELRLGHGAAVEGVIIGVGLDVAPLTDPPVELRSVAISLSEACGRPVSRALVARSLVDSLGRGYDAMLQRGAFDRNGWLERTDLLGRRVTVRPPGGALFSATAVTLRTDGALVVERPDGALESVICGDVEVVRAGEDLEDVEDVEARMSEGG